MNNKKKKRKEMKKRIKKRKKKEKKKHKKTKHTNRHIRFQFHNFLCHRRQSMGIVQDFISNGVGKGEMKHNYDFFSLE
jgi:hypothetical protein